MPGRKDNGSFAVHAVAFGAFIAKGMKRSKTDDHQDYEKSPFHFSPPLKLI
jgi:hypothetical protein